MLLCDAAEEANGKLFILGGGWSVLRRPSPMALAIRLSVPWDRANEPHTITATLLDEDGETVDPGEGPITVEGIVEVGRPAGVKPGTPLDSPFVLSFPPLPLEAGRYVWELEAEGATLARAAFTVLAEAPATT